MVKYIRNKGIIEISLKMNYATERTLNKYQTRAAQGPGMNWLQKYRLSSMVQGAPLSILAPVYMQEKLVLQQLDLGKPVLQVSLHACSNHVIVDGQ